MICATLGLSDGDARALAAKGILLADALNDGNFALYSRQTLERLKSLKAQGKLFDAAAASTKRPPGYTAEQGARVFELLRAKTSGERIVIDERLHPRLVLEIREDYERCIGELEISKAMVARVNDIATSRGEPRVESSLDLMLFIEKLARPRICPRCDDNPSTTLCMECASTRG
jgi:hypothetical protein